MTSSDSKPIEIKPIRCAIYTRKSTSEGSEQDFTSLDAQREAGTNYVASQKSQGWISLEDKYDDYGFTGASSASCPNGTKLIYFGESGHARHGNDWNDDQPCRTWVEKTGEGITCNSRRGSMPGCGNQGTGLCQ